MKIHLHHRRLNDPLRGFLPLLFPIIQGWHRDFGLFRIRVTHRLRIMPERLLRKSFRIYDQLVVVVVVVVVVVEEPPPPLSTA